MSDEEDTPLVIDQSPDGTTKLDAEQEEKMQAESPVQETEPPDEQGAPLGSAEQDAHEKSDEQDVSLKSAEPDACFMPNDQDAPQKSDEEDTTFKSSKEDAPVVLGEQPAFMKSAEQVALQKSDDEDAPLNSGGQDAAQVSDEEDNPQKSYEQDASLKSGNQDAPQKSDEQDDPHKSAEQDVPLKSAESDAPQMSDEDDDPQKSAEQDDPQKSAEQDVPLKSAESGAPQMSDEDDDPQMSDEQDDPQKSDEQDVPLKSTKSDAPQMPDEDDDPQKSAEQDVPLKSVVGGVSQKSADQNIPLKSSESEYEISNSEKKEDKAEPMDGIHISPAVHTATAQPAEQTRMSTSPGDAQNIEREVDSKEEDVLDSGSEAVGSDKESVQIESTIETPPAPINEEKADIDIVMKDDTPSDDITVNNDMSADAVTSEDFAPPSDATSKNDTPDTDETPPDDNKLNLNEEPSDDTMQKDNAPLDATPLNDRDEEPCDDTMSKDVNDQDEEPYDDTMSKDVNDQDEEPCDDTMSKDDPPHDDTGLMNQDAEPHKEMSNDGMSPDDITLRDQDEGPSADTMSKDNALPDGDASKDDVSPEATLKNPDEESSVGTSQVPAPAEDYPMEDTTEENADADNKETNDTNDDSPSGETAESAVQSHAVVPADSPAEILADAPAAEPAEAADDAADDASTAIAADDSVDIPSPTTTISAASKHTIDSSIPATGESISTPADTPASVTTNLIGAATTTAVNSSGTPATPTATPASTPVTPTTPSSRTPGGVGGTPRSRVTRSHNPVFAAKQKSFMKRYHRSVSAGGGGNSSAVTSDAPRAEKRAGDDSAPPAKRRRRGSEDDTASSAANAVAQKNDNFCWVCRREGQLVCCEACPRVFHLKCAQLPSDPPGDWVCVECRRLVEAETAERRVPADRLRQLIKYAIGRLKGLPGAEPFLQPVNERKFPTYRDFICCPMDLSTMEQNNNRGEYGTTEAFIADCKWILHNCVLFNGMGSKLTTLAKSLLRMCKWEMEEIETCPDCYGNAYVSDNWFTMACPHPHLLIWARLKGFPFWPAKAMRVRDGNVDCRFFGRHDRAWVPAKECFLFSREPPAPPKHRVKSLDACVEELEDHVKILEKKFGKYHFPKARVQYNPNRINAQLKMTIPGYKGRPTSDRSGSKRSSELGVLDRLRQDKKARHTGAELEPEPKPALKQKPKPAPDQEPAPEPKLAPKQKPKPAPDQEPALEPKPAVTETAREASSKSPERTSSAPEAEPAEPDSTDTEPDTNTGTDTDKHTGGKANSGTGTGTSAKAEATKTSTVIEVISDTSSESNTNSKLDTDTCTKTDINTKTKTDMNTKTKPDTKTKAKADTKTKTKADTRTKTKEEMKTKTKEGTKTETMADANSGTKSNKNNTPKTDTNIRSKTDKNTKSKTDAITKTKKDTSADVKGNTDADASRRPEKEPVQEEARPASGRKESSDSDRSHEGSLVIDEGQPETVEVEVEKEEAAAEPEKKEQNKSLAVKVVVVDPDTINARLAKAEDERLAKAAAAKAAEAEKASTPKVQAAARKAVKAEPPEPVTAPVKRPFESGGAAEGEQEEPRPRRRTARKSLSAAATGSALSSATQSPAGGTPKAVKSFSNPANVPAPVPGGPSLPASRLLARLSANQAAKLKPQTISVTPPAPPPAGSRPQRSGTVTTARSTGVRVVMSGPQSSVVKPATSASMPSIQICRPKVTAVSNNGVTQQVLAAPLRPKLLTSPSAAPRAPPPSTSSTLPQPIIVNRGGTRLMIPRNSLNQLYLPGVTSPGGAVTGVVIPSGSGANGPAAALVTYPGGAAAEGAGAAEEETRPEVGPLTAMVERHSQELTGMMRRGVEKLLDDLSASDCTPATVARLKMKMERMRWQHTIELEEQKKAADARIADLKATLSQEQKSASLRLTSAVQAEARNWERVLEQRVQETKKKQWCANCGKEAIFYCCWNTSYCDFPCQEAQWPKHMLTCANQQGNSAAAADGGGDTDPGRLHRL